jgi:hypothetical protein
MHRIKEKPGQMPGFLFPVYARYPQGDLHCGWTAGRLDGWTIKHVTHFNVAQYRLRPPIPTLLSNLGLNCSYCWRQTNHVLGNFPQTVANSMNWRVTISKDNLPSSLQPGERF